MTVILTASDLTYSLVAGEEVTTVLPCGLEVRIRALAPSDRDGARARATRRTRIDPSFGQVVARIVAQKAEQLAASSPDAPQGDEAEARILYLLARQDPQAHEAYEGLKVWNAAVTLEVAAEGLVSCAALGIEGGSTVEATSARLRAIRRPDVLSTVITQLYVSIRTWSETGDLGKAAPVQRSGSTSA